LALRSSIVIGYLLKEVCDESFGISDFNVRAARDFGVACAVKADGSLEGTWAGKGSSKIGTGKLTRK
jgi:hypothetical protein